MNKYIKKCLVVYISLVVILCGMVGITYAITASDADQYITRSQYATDMNHLQSKLEEKESSIMGKINKYRSTDVKFVTYDNPIKQHLSGTTNFIGKYNGGNYFPRQYPGNGGGRYATYDTIGSQKQGTNAHLNLYRLYNGNYLISNAMGYSDDSTYTLFPTTNFAVPCENLPGWYLECRLQYQSWSTCYYLVSLLKLDATVPYQKPYATERNRIHNMELMFRFKKDFFIYTSDYATKLTPTPTTYSTNVSRFYNSTYNQPFSYCYSNTESSNSEAVTIRSWLDEDTGDYMMGVKGLYANIPDYASATMWFANSNIGLSRLIVSDNVEYQCGNTYGWIFTNTGGNNGQSQGGYPPPCHIGEGPGAYGDGYWEYEFVDCENGIKYWHAYRKARNANPTGETGTGYSSVGVHYNIPILY